MKKSRLEYSILNSSISMLIYIFRLVIQFVGRSYFIHFLGAQYLGLNGLFSNILSFLSLAELGIGTSIVYSLYKPLAKNDQQQIVSLMRLYKKAYEAIGIVIGLIGLLVIPLLPIIINHSNNIEMNKVYVYYVLFLINSVVSYFFTYKRSLIIADQKNYIVSFNDFIFLFIMNAVQIISIYFYQNFALFLIIQIVFTLLGNISISKVTDKNYTFLSVMEPQKIDNEVRDEIKKNVIGNMSSKLGGVIVMGTDNILISSFVSLTAVGIYSNYSLIVISIQNLCKQITNSVTASLGNFAVSGDRNRASDLYDSHLFINHSLIYFSSILLLVLINPFIHIWVGEDYSLPILTVTLVIVNYAIQVYRNTNFVFIESFGLYWQQRYKPVLEAGINLIISLIFLMVFNWGINGVLLGTIISSLGFVFWYELYVVTKYAFRKGMATYVFQFLRYIFELLVSATVVYWAVDHSTLRIDNGFIDLLIRLILSSVLSFVLYLGLYWKNNNFKFVIRILKKIVRR